MKHFETSHMASGSRGIPCFCAGVGTAGLIVLGMLGGCLASHDDFMTQPGMLSGMVPVESSAATPEQMPDDFTLSITVRAPGVDEAVLAGRPRSERPGRYIIEPDGVLRAAIGPGATPRVFPGQTRRLDDRQMDRLWRLVLETGLLEPGSITRIENTETYFPYPGRSTALISITAEGQTTYFAVRLPVGDAPSRATAQLIEAIADLAWIPRQ